MTGMPTPQRHFLMTFFRFRAPNVGAMRCAIYRVGAAVELRLEYEDRDELTRVRLFADEDHDAVTALGDGLPRMLLATGFEELPRERPH